MCYALFVHQYRDTWLTDWISRFLDGATKQLEIRALLYNPSLALFAQVRSLYLLYSISDP